MLNKYFLVKIRIQNADILSTNIKIVTSLHCSRARSVVNKNLKLQSKLFAPDMFKSIRKHGKLWMPTVDVHWNGPKTQLRLHQHHLSTIALLL